MVPSLDSQMKTRIRQLHASGYEPREISARIRVNLAMTRIYMNRLGLKDKNLDAPIKKVQPSMPEGYSNEYRYDSPGQIVIDVSDFGNIPSRPVSVFSISSIF